jgi:hypothetical protein
MAGILEGVASGKEVGFAEAGGNPPNSVSRRVSDPIGTHGGADGLLFNCPEGPKNLAQGFNPGKHPIKRFALTRHMNVRSMKNTRFAGLEMLKGREMARAKCPSNAIERELGIS